MHEAYITENIIKIVDECVRKERPVPAKITVKRIKLKFGKMSGVVSDSVKFCFDIMAKDTILEDARLEIEEIPVTALCRDCNRTFRIEEVCFFCRECGRSNIEILTGREILVDAIEFS